MTTAIATGIPRHLSSRMVYQVAYTDGKNIEYSDIVRVGDAVYRYLQSFNELNVHPGAPRAVAIPLCRLKGKAVPK